MPFCWIKSDWHRKKSRDAVGAYIMHSYSADSIYSLESLDFICSKVRHSRNEDLTEMILAKQHASGPDSKLRLTKRLQKREIGIEVLDIPFYVIYDPTDCCYKASFDQ
jgi:hypothetical protein